MKRIIFIIAISIPILFICFLFLMHIWIGVSVKKNIELVQQQYRGSPEDALISFLLDEENTYHDRTHIAIWTLGQIRSEKALPILKELYKDDPKGKSCFGRHDSVLCQYEIHKAIQTIEKKWLFSHARLK